MDVDTAIAEAPVNVMPLIDDTDFKTIEAAVVYNAAGMALIWHFVTTAGVMTETAVTPTTAGAHDWTDQGTSGLYALEIPASAGTINNNTEGFGWFTGVATGVLPWRGPVLGFRAAALNNALIDGGDVLDANVTEWLGTAAATPTTAGVPEVDVTFVSGTAQTANDNGADINTILSRIIGTLATGTHNPATAAQIAVLSDWINGGRLDLILDIIAADTTTDIPALIATAQADLDTITGADGVTLATAQGLYAPAKAGDNMGTVSSVTGNVDGSTASVTGAVGSVTGAVGSVTGNVGGNVAGSTASVTGAVGSVTGNVGGNVTGSVGSNLELGPAEVNAECDTALADYDGPTNAEMEVRTPSATELAYIVDHAKTAAPLTFTGGTTTTAILGNVDGSAASSVDDFYNGAVLVFNAGTLDEQRTDITDYVGSTKTATITAVTTAVTSSHTALLV